MLTFIMKDCVSKHNISDERKEYEIETKTCKEFLEASRSHIIKTLSKLWLEKKVSPCKIDGKV